MITFMLGAFALILYVLGVVLAKEYVDYIEEATEDFLPRPGAYWRFILLWPFHVTQGFLLKEEDYE